MGLRHKAINAITDADVNELIAVQEPEGRTLDYKLDLRCSTDDEQKSICFDICSFANALGGDIIYGIEEEADERGHTGLPKRAIGLVAANLDDLQRRIEQIVGSRIQPRVPPLHFQRLKGDSGPILLLRVQQSWAAPHAVVYNEWSKFYVRGNTLNTIMTIDQIRAAFALSEALPERMRRFHDERLDHLRRRKQLPVQIQDTSLLVFHFLPFAAFDRSIGINIQPAILQGFKPISVISPDEERLVESNRYNLEGYILSDLLLRHVNRPSRGYVQVYRNGAIEIVAGLTTQWNLLLAQGLGCKIMDYIKRCLQVMRDAQIPQPMFLFTALLNMQGQKLQVRSVPTNLPEGTDIYPFDRDEIELPEVLLESLDTPADALLRPVLDALWQAAGFPYFVE